MALKKAWKRVRPTFAGRILNIPLRFVRAARVAGVPLARVPRWVLTSNEDTNFTFPLQQRSWLYLAHEIANITGVTVADVERLIVEGRTSERLRQYLESMQGLREYRHLSDARADFGRRLGWYAFARIMKPDVIVETGVDKGLGAVLLCEALLKNGHGCYYGTDIDPNAGKMLAGEYRTVGEILYGDSIESIRGLAGPVDLFINDSDHSDEYEAAEYRTVEPLLSRRAIILGDNAHMTDKLALWSAETGRAFSFWKEESQGHWYPGVGIGISYDPNEWPREMDLTAPSAATLSQ